jgi:hypothetical protein
MSFRVCHTVALGNLQVYCGDVAKDLRALRLKVVATDPRLRPTAAAARDALTGKRPGAADPRLQPAAATRHDAPTGKQSANSSGSDVVAGEMRERQAKMQECFEKIGTH